MATNDKEPSTSALPTRKSGSSSSARKVNKAAKTGGGPHRKMQTPPSIIATLIVIVLLGTYFVGTSRAQSIEDARPRATITSGSGASRTVVRAGDAFSAAYGFYVCDAKPADGAVPTTPATDPVATDPAATDPAATDPAATVPVASPGKSAVAPRQTDGSTEITAPTDVSIAEQTPVPVSDLDPSVGADPAETTTTTTTIPPDPYGGNRQSGFVLPLQNNNANGDASANGFYTRNARLTPADTTFLPKGDGVIYATPFDDKDIANTDDKNRLVSATGAPLEYVYSGRRARLSAFFNTASVTTTANTLDLSAARIAEGDPIKPSKKWTTGDMCPGDKKGVLKSWVGELSSGRLSDITAIKDKAVADRTAVVQSADTEDVKKSRIAEIETKARTEIMDIINRIKLNEVVLEPNELRMRDNAVFVISFLPDDQEPPLPIDGLTTLYAVLPNSANAADTTTTTTTTTSVVPTTVAP
jgi:hypothetical protein